MREGHTLPSRALPMQTWDILRYRRGKSHRPYHLARSAGLSTAERSHSQWLLPKTLRRWLAFLEADFKSRQLQ